MPLRIVPITHKFGIISQTHKKLLQQRLVQARQDFEKRVQLKKEKSEKLVMFILNKLPNNN